MEISESKRRIFFRRFFLIAYDTSAVIISGLLALFVRFDFVFPNIEKKYIDLFIKYAWVQILITIALFYIFRLYHSLWAYAGLVEILNIIGSAFAADLLYFIFIHYYVQRNEGVRMPYSFYCLFGVFLVCFVAGSRILYRYCRQIYHKHLSDHEAVNTMIVGAGEAGYVILKEITSSQYLNLKVKCIIDDDRRKVGQYIKGVKIVGNRFDIPDCVNMYDIKKIIIAMPTASKKDVHQIIEICQNTRCEIKMLPGIYQFMNGEVSVSKLRNIEIEDLLGREPIHINFNNISNYITNKTVLVTGAGGSIGSELCRQIAVHNPAKMILFDIYENTTYDIQLELMRKYPDLDLVVLIGSICDHSCLQNLFAKYHPNIIYHAAAHKHVPLMEDSPIEAVNNNVFGTLELVEMADKYHVERFVLISSDKAVNPTNVMGTTKRICEMMIQYYNMHSNTEYVAVRFGNVLASNGSVIPLFRKQIEEGGPVTVTHPDIMRYFMTIPEAVALVLEAGAFAKGGEIFVLDMGEPMKILDLATKLIRLSGYIPYEDIKIEFIGLRPGEKLFEELLMNEEGIKKTSHELIYIGKPIDMDYEHFYLQLEQLKSYVNHKGVDIRSELKKIVPTYNPMVIESSRGEKCNNVKQKMHRKEEKKIACTHM